MYQYTFQQGYSYVAAFDKPFIASASMIKSGVEDQGFRVEAYYECEKSPTFPFVPPTRARCGKDYSHVAVVTRTARTERVDVPSQVKWIVQVPKEQPKPIPQPGGPPGGGIQTGKPTEASSPIQSVAMASSTSKSLMYAAAGGIGIIVFLKLFGK